MNRLDVFGLALAKAGAKRWRGGAGGLGKPALVWLCVAGVATWDLPAGPSTTRTWNGGTSGNWRVAANWNPYGYPQSNDSVVFNSAAGGTLVNDLSAFAFGTFTFGVGAGPFSLSGNDLTWGGNLVDNASSDEILNCNLSLGSYTRAVQLGGSGNLTLGGVISGTGGLLKDTSAGTGALILKGANTYSGETTIARGTVSIETIGNVNGGASSLGAPASVAAGTIKLGSTNNSACLVYTGGGASTDRVIDMVGTTGGAALQSDGTGPLVFTSDFKASVTGDKTLFLQGSSTAENEVRGKVVDSPGGATSLTKLGIGKWILSADNTFVGQTTIEAGTLQLGTGGSSGSVVGNISNNAVLLFNHANDVLMNSGVISGSGVVVQNGSGKLIMGRAHIYQGGTLINTGTLQVSNVLGSATGSGNVTVAAGAKITGAGAMSGQLVLHGTLAPGSSAGTLRAGAAQFNGGAAYLWEMKNPGGSAGADWDVLRVANDLVLNASPANPFTVRLLGLGADNAPGEVAGFDANADQTWTIATAANIVGFDAQAVALSWLKSEFANDLHGGVFSVQTNLVGANWELQIKFSANHRPVANDLNQSLGKGVLFRVSIASLLANSTSDADGDPRLLTGVGSAAYGTIYSNAAYLVYLPTSDANDHFSYTVTDPRPCRAGDSAWTSSANIVLNKVDKGGAVVELTQSGGANRVVFAGIPGYRYAVERAPSVSGPWAEVLASTNAPAAGLFEFVDETPPAGTAFYRLVYNQ